MTVCADNASKLISLRMFLPLTILKNDLKLLVLTFRRCERALQITDPL